MEHQLKECTEQIDELRAEIDQYKLTAASWTEHWNTIDLLFGSDKLKHLDEESLKPPVFHKESQTQLGKM